MKLFTALNTNQAPGLPTWLSFLIPSVLGIFLFMTPVTVGGEFSIPVALLASALKSTLGSSLVTIITMIIVFTGGVTLATKLFYPKAIINQPFLASLFDISVPWTLVRLAGVAFVLMAYFEAGPMAVWSENTGGMVLHDLLPTLFSVFIFAGLLLPLLMNFGLLEFLGTLLTKVMRPVFNLPGRSSVTCMASWLGDGSVGILMTSKQYESAQYTQREAAVIGTTFLCCFHYFCSCSDCSGGAAAYVCTVLSDSLHRRCCGGSYRS